MKLIAIMPVRSEAWCIGASLRSLLRWVDHVVILDHCTTDSTPDIVGETARADAMRMPEEKRRVRITYFEDKDPTWREMAHRQRLLETARELGATHIATVDADEVLTANLEPHIREIIEALQPGELLQLPWIALPRSRKFRLTDGIWARNWVTMAFADHPDFCWKARDGYDFHHRHPVGSNLNFVQRPVQEDEGGLMHLQFLSERRLRAKQRLYKLIEKTRWPDRRTVEEINAMYDRAVYESCPDRYPSVEIPKEWWNEEDARQLRQWVIPWQEAEAERLLTEHGREYFAGLDLFEDE
jgi:hypothetical protein